MKFFIDAVNASIRNEQSLDTEQMLHIIVDDNQQNTIVLINCLFLCGVVSCLGGITNIINLIIFYNHGLNSTINISFFSLAMSDFCSVVAQQMCNLYINPFFVALRLPIVYPEVEWASARLARVIFARNTFFITVYITAERCLCVVFPLHIKQIITPRKTISIVISIYVATLGAFLPMLCSYYLDWKFYPSKNVTLLGLVFRPYKNIGFAITVFLQAIFSLFAFTAIVILTLILIFKLKQKSDWQKNANLSHKHSNSMSQRDMTTVKMVVLIASLLIICYIPSVLLCIVMFIEPEFTAAGRYKNLYSSLWSVAMVMENINSSVNIFFYFRMSSRYRQTFKELFFVCCRNRKTRF